MKAKTPPIRSLELYRRVKPFRDPEAGFWLNYYADEPGRGSRPVATIQVSRHEGPKLDRECRENLRQLERDVGHKLIPFEVDDARIEDVQWMERGVGVRMYADAVERLAKFGGALMASNCFIYWRDYGGEGEDATSHDAMHVWGSKRLSELVNVDGRAAVSTKLNPDIKRKLMR